jgi:hypothetical protein
LLALVPLINPHGNVCLKVLFMDIDEDELQIVNKGNRQLNKHSKIWAKNAFDALHEF